MTSRNITTLIIIKIKVYRIDIVALVGTKIHCFGGRTSDVPDISGEFFYLDVSNSIDKTKGALIFVDLSDKALEELPQNYGAAATVSLKD